MQNVIVICGLLLIFVAIGVINGNWSWLFVFLSLCLTVLAWRKNPYMLKRPFFSSLEKFLNAKSRLRDIKSGKAFITVKSGERYLPGVKPGQEQDVINRYIRQRNEAFADMISCVVVPLAPIVIALLINRWR